MRIPFDIIDKLLKVILDNNLSEISVEDRGRKITLKRAPRKEGAAAAENPREKWVPITSPFVGTFYASPSPTSPLFVKLGDMVEKGQTVCIVEAMKVMNEVKSHRRGRVAEILVQNSEAVEYGQTLLFLEPEEG